MTRWRAGSPGWVSARAASVSGGTWVGGNEECRNYFEFTWRASAQALTLSWISAPQCSEGIGKPKVLARGQVLDPAQAGHNLIVQPNQVGFLYPLRAPQLPYNVNGTLFADGTGRVSANLHEGACTYDITNLVHKRK